MAHPDDEHRALDFVGGSSDELGGDCIHWVVQHADGRHELQARRFTLISLKTWVAHL